jgi:hypothetical protein
MGDARDPEKIMTRADLVVYLRHLRMQAATGSGKVRLSLRDVARATDIPKSTLAGYLSGTTMVPPDVLGKIVMALGVSAEDASAWVGVARRLAEQNDDRVTAIPAAAATAVPAAAATAPPGGETAPALGSDTLAPGLDPPHRPRRRFGRRPVLLAVALGAALILAAVAVPLIGLTEADQPTPVTITRVDSWVSVTPNDQGVVRIPYCPVREPCRFPEVPQVLVTARAPQNGPSIPAGLVAYAATTIEFTLRALDQRGKPIKGPVQVWYHAAVTAQQPHDEIGTATTRTDDRGFATIRYRSGGRGTPVAVVASGVQPSNGRAIPGSVVVTDRSTDTFRIRALNHAGAVIALEWVTVAYRASWTGEVKTDRYTSRDATTNVTTNASGFATIPFRPPLPAVPTGIQAVGVSPARAPGTAATVIAYLPTEDGFLIRVLDAEGRSVPARQITISYHAAAGHRTSRS